jgi:hypothetical protein
MPSDKGWQRAFENPITLPNGKKLTTFAATYITKLPKREHDAPEWQAATEALLLVVDLNGPVMFARLGIMRALNDGKPKPKPTPRRKRARAFSGRPPPRLDAWPNI